MALPGACFVSSHSVSHEGACGAIACILRKSSLRGQVELPPEIGRGVLSPPPVLPVGQEEKPSEGAPGPWEDWVGSQEGRKEGRTQAVRTPQVDVEKKEDATPQKGAGSCLGRRQGGAVDCPSPWGGGGGGTVIEMPKVRCLCVSCLVSACSSVTLVFREVLSLARNPKGPDLGLQVVRAERVWGAEVIGQLGPKRKPEEKRGTQLGEKGATAPRPPPPPAGPL